MKSTLQDTSFVIELIISAFFSSSHEVCLLSEQVAFENSYPSFGTIMNVPFSSLFIYLGLFTSNVAFIGSVIVTSYFAFTKYNSHVLSISSAGTNFHSSVLKSPVRLGSQLNL